MANLGEDEEVIMVPIKPPEKTEPEKLEPIPDDIPFVFPMEPIKEPIPVPTKV